VIKTLEGFCVAVLFATDLRAAMRTGVEHGAQCALGIAGEQDATATDLTGDEIAGLGKLGSVAEIEPALVEDPCAFGFENVGIDKGLAGNLENLLGLADHERGIHSLECVHCSPSIKTGFIVISTQIGGRNLATQDRRAAAWCWPQ